jgi:CRP/FNR family transcriptional regulator, cyclic AMP receptor protein
MAPRIGYVSDPVGFFTKGASGTRHIAYKEGEVIFAQGDSADAVYYIEQGRIKKSYISSRGKERVVAILQAHEFLGLGCIVGRAQRRMTATAMSKCVAVRIDKPVMLRVLYEQPDLAETVISYLIDRNGQYQEDLVDHLFNTSEKRLARTLCQLSNVESEDGEDVILPKISQETLAEIVGTTRSRINFFMKKFREQGFIEYENGIRVRRALFGALLNGKAG